MVVHPLPWLVGQAEVELRLLQVAQADTAARLQTILLLVVVDTALAQTLRVAADTEVARIHKVVADTAPVHQQPMRTAQDHLTAEIDMAVRQLPLAQIKISKSRNGSLDEEQDLLKITVHIRIAN